MNKKFSFSKRTLRIEVPCLSGTASVDIRSLSINEIQRLLLLARKTGWYGNTKLIDFVVDCGLSHNKTDIKTANHDVYFLFNIARKIWILTLQYLHERLGYLLPFSNRIKKLNRIKEYEFSDLATPGLLFLIKRDMVRIDVEAYVEILLNHAIVSIKRRGKTLTKSERNRLMKERRDEVLEWWYEVHNIEEGSLKKLPSSIFQTEYEKFYAMEQLARTLDWVQYYEILFAYNTILTELNFNSNQLGGLDCTVTDAHLITGIPLLFDLIRSPQSIPLEVCIALLQDELHGNLTAFSPREKTQIRESLDIARKKTAEVLNDGNLKKSKEDIVLEYANRFAVKIIEDKKIVSKACTIYWSQFCSHMENKFRKKMIKEEKEYRVLMLPDCYVLVEGISDEIIFEHLLRLLHKQEVTIEVQGCGSKEGVLRRFRDLNEKESYIGSIVTILDADATLEHHELQRLTKNNSFIKHFIYSHGTVEDLFPIQLHVKILNELYPGGDGIQNADLQGNKPIAGIIKKALWNSKKVDFDKKNYAETIAKKMWQKGDIPEQAVEIVASIIDIAMQRAKKLPKLYSHLSIDRMSRNRTKPVISQKP